MNCKTFIATHADNTAGNKNTSVFTEAWSPVKIQDQQFQMLTVDCGPRHGPFCRRPQQKVSRPLLFQEHRRHFASSREEVNVPFRPTGAIATVFEVKPLTLMVECNLVTPTIDAPCECTTSTEVAEGEVPDENSLVTYPGSASFLLAPWLADAMIAVNSSDPFPLIMVIYQQQHPLI